MNGGDTNSNEDDKTGKENVAMSTDQMRQQANSWSLAGDVGLRKYLESFAQNLEAKSLEFERGLSQLERRISTTHTSIGMWQISICLPIEI